ncbi:MAG: hypothetical protein WBK37_01895 [Kiritimatiellia bacterium]
MSHEEKLYDRRQVTWAIILFVAGLIYLPSVPYYFIIRKRVLEDISGVDVVSVDLYIRTLQMLDVFIFVMVPLFCLVLLLAAIALFKNCVVKNK